jgi:hypothetical protein
MRFHGLEQNKSYTVSDVLKNKSASLLASLKYSVVNNIDYNLTQIANVCFSENENKEHALNILKEMKSKILEHIIGRYDFPEFMATMIQLHPISALEVFIGEGTEVECQIKNAVKGIFDKKVSPFSQVDKKSTLVWCENNGKDSYPILASIIKPYQSVEKLIEWTPLAIGLLKSCPEPTKVLDEYLSNLSPSGWTGSRAKILESRLPLFQSLLNSDNNEISAWAIDKEAQWKKFIACEYEREIVRDIDRNERFEW